MTAHSIAVNDTGNDDIPDWSKGPERILERWIVGN